jgi:opacity protein-like surface antigen
MVPSLYGRGLNRSILAGAWLVLVLAAPASAEEPRLGRGIKEFALAGGFSSSHDVSGTATGITAMHLLPHYGWFVTDPGEPRWLPGWLRGSLELSAELTYLKINRNESTNFVGPTAVARWVFATEGWLRPYVEAGVGALVGESGTVQTDCDLNFSLQAGTGVLLFWSERHAVTLGYRFHHLSNGNLCEGNRGLNSALFILGISTFFP